jgi:acetyltransferase-like isoleucine patch superfamily enzyme
MPLIIGRINIKGRGLIEFGNNVKIISSVYENPVGLSIMSSFYCNSGAQIKIGNNVSLSNSLLFAKKSIIIEDYVMIGGGCQIMDTDFHSLNYEERLKFKDEKVQSKDVLIKRGAFIGASVIVLKGVIIGEKSIVAAGSVVTKSIPDNQIWGGNPAKFIRNVC